MKNKVLYLLAITFLTGCWSATHNEKRPISKFSTTHVGNKNNVVNIKVEIPDKIPKNVDFDKFVKNIKYIRLETNRQSVIGEISKLVYYNNNFYIMDKVSNSLLVFDKTGKFIRKIGEKGRGPGEYDMIYDFDIDRKHNQVIMYADKNLRYTTTGEFVSKIYETTWCYHFACLSNNIAFDLGYRKNTGKVEKEHNLIITDSLGNIITGYFRYNSDNITEYYPKQFNNFYYFDKHAYYYPSLKDTIYKITKDGAEVLPVYAIDFGEKQLDISILKENINKQKEYFHGSTYASAASVYETKKNLNLMVSYHSILYNFYYSKSSLKTLIYVFIGENNNMLGSPVGSTDEFFIGKIYQMEAVMRKNQMKNHTYTDNGLTDILKDYKLSDNPILVTYELEL